jgi:hypothetical protein
MRLNTYPFSGISPVDEVLVAKKFPQYGIVWWNKRSNLRAFLLFAAVKGKCPVVRQGAPTGAENRPAFRISAEMRSRFSSCMVMVFPKLKTTFATGYGQNTTTENCARIESPPVPAGKGLEF